MILPVYDPSYLLQADVHAFEGRYIYTASAAFCWPNVSFAPIEPFPIQSAITTSLILFFFKTMRDSAYPQHYFFAGWSYAGP